MLDQRGRLLLTVLAFAGLRPKTGVTVVEIETVRRWLDTWRGIGDVAVGMHRQGYDLHLTEYDDRGWRATFYPSGIEHSATSATGSAWESTPWRAVQQAAWDALRRPAREGSTNASGVSGANRATF